jgi:hypothetical protein
LIKQKKSTSIDFRTIQIQRHFQYSFSSFLFIHSVQPRHCAASKGAGSSDTARWIAANLTSFYQAQEWRQKWDQWFYNMPCIVNFLLVHRITLRKYPLCSMLGVLEMHFVLHCWIWTFSCMLLFQKKIDMYHYNVISCLFGQRLPLISVYIFVFKCAKDLLLWNNCFNLWILLPYHPH